MPKIYKSKSFLKKTAYANLHKKCCSRHTYNKIKHYSRSKRNISITHMKGGSIASDCAKLLLDIYKSTQQQTPDPYEDKHNPIMVFKKYTLTNYEQKEEDGKIVLQLTNRQEQYDLCFLCSVMCILHNYTEPVYYSVSKKIIKNANDDVKCCDEKKKHRLQFFMEDFYIDDLTKFIKEYDDFIVSDEKISIFLFQSNIVNISMLLKCYQRRCFDEFFKTATSYSDKRLHIKDQSLADKSLEDLFTIFNEYKLILIECLITAYSTFKYDDLCTLYINYLHFYNDSIHKDTNGIFHDSLFTNEKHNDIDFKKEQEGLNKIIDTLQQKKQQKKKHNNNKLSQLSHNQTEAEKQNIIQSDQYIYRNIVKDIYNSSKTHDYFIYLSCSHVAEFKQARIYMTRFVDTYIGGSFVHVNVLLNTINVICHDFYFHRSIKRIKEHGGKDNIVGNNRDFIMDLYTTDVTIGKKIYKYGMYILQILQNEAIPITVIDFDKETILAYFVHYNNLIYNNANAGYEFTIKDTETDTLDKFIHYLDPDTTITVSDIKKSVILQPEINTNYSIFKLTDPAAAAAAVNENYNNNNF